MSQGAVSFGYFEQERKREGERVRQLEGALEVLAGMVSQKEFVEMAGDVKRGLRELRIENGFVVTCLTPEHT